MGNSWKLDLDQFGHVTIIFAPKLITLLFSLIHPIRMPSISKTACSADISIVALLSV